MERLLQILQQPEFGDFFLEMRTSAGTAKRLATPLCTYCPLYELKQGLAGNHVPFQGNNLGNFPDKSLPARPALDMDNKVKGARYLLPCAATLIIR